MLHYRLIRHYIHATVKLYRLAECPVKADLVKLASSLRYRDGIIWGHSAFTIRLDPF